MNTRRARVELMTRDRTRRTGIRYENMDTWWGESVRDDGVGPGEWDVETASSTGYKI